MRIKYVINIGNLALVDYVDFEAEPSEEDELHAPRDIWETFINGDSDTLESYEWRTAGEEWWVQAEGEKAEVNFGSYSYLRVEIPLALLKAEMRRVLEEHDAAVAAGGAEEAGE